MKFVVTITTPTRSKPNNRPADVRERAAIQQALLQVVGAVSNCGTYEGSVAGGTAKGEYSYQCDGEAA
jgi:hypothetical protein